MVLQGGVMSNAAPIITVEYISNCEPQPDHEASRAMRGPPAPRGPAAANATARSNQKLQYLAGAF
jgi:hypothetical protein